MSRGPKGDLKGIAFFESHCLTEEQVLDFTRAFAAVCDRHDVRHVPPEGLRDVAVHAPMLRQASAAIYAFATDVLRLLATERALVAIRAAEMTEVLKLLPKYAGVSLAAPDLLSPRALAPSVVEAFAKIADECLSDLEKAASIVARNSYRFGGVTRKQVRDIVMPSHMAALLHGSVRDLLTEADEMEEALGGMLQRLQAAARQQGEDKGLKQQRREEVKQAAANDEPDIVG